MNNDVLPLLGEWNTDPEDVESIRNFGNVSLEFKEDGSLIFTIHGEEKDQKIFLTYKVSGGYIITDQPSHPAQERSAYMLTKDDTLVLSYGQHTSRFIRKSSNCGRV